MKIAMKSTTYVSFKVHPQKPLEMPPLLPVAVFWLDECTGAWRAPAAHFAACIDARADARTLSDALSRGVVQ